MNFVSIIYSILGVFLIGAISVITYYAIDFLKNYNKTISQADITIKLAESSFMELDLLIDNLSSKMNSIEHFFEAIDQSGKSLNAVNGKFEDVSKIIERYPSGVIAALVVLLKIERIDDLGRLFAVKTMKTESEGNKEMNNMLKDFVKGAVVGGLAVALLTPKTGKEVREIALKKLDELSEKAKEIEFDDVREGIFNKIEELKEYVKTGNKEDIINKVFEEIKDLYEKIKHYLTDVSESAKEKLNY
ncbi:YtxH domain-containing protein [Haloplasma contractile]|uniref:YtxH-like protein n=1 Tax=Haloplasma contractile SSD-17B TaxID=1033810 RepID=U2FRN9_9MOLU|nr:YtxH domain-containing protein [Haloplasma contractile]ERJ13629.1 YtxH-like protein [Haloplasma contractile SSD-17B]